ncbi:MAG: hypothetical protein V1735_07640 [Nanoarchaeota archaeon]
MPVQVISVAEDLEQRFFEAVKRLAFKPPERELIYYFHFFVKDRQDWLRESGLPYWMHPVGAALKVMEREGSRPDCRLIIGILGHDLVEEGRRQGKEKFTFDDFEEELWRLAVRNYVGNIHKGAVSPQEMEHLQRYISINYSFRREGLPREEPERYRQRLDDVVCPLMGEKGIVDQMMSALTWSGFLGSPSHIDKLRENLNDLVAIAYLQDLMTQRHGECYDVYLNRIFFIPDDDKIRLNKERAILGKTDDRRGNTEDTAGFARKQKFMGWLFLLYKNLQLLRRLKIHCQTYRGRFEETFNPVIEAHAGSLIQESIVSGRGLEQMLFDQGRGVGGCEFADRKKLVEEYLGNPRALYASRKDIPLRYSKIESVFELFDRISHRELDKGLIQVTPATLPLLYQDAVLFRGMTERLEHDPKYFADPVACTRSHK